MGPTTRETRSELKKQIVFKDVVKQIDNATLTTETRNIFKILLEFMNNLVSEREDKVSLLEIKIEQERSENDAKVAAIETKFEKSNAENIELRSQITKLKNTHDELEAYGRRESLIFSGEKIKPFESGENCVTLAKDIIKNELKLSVDPIISTAHRMGRPPAPTSNAPDKRSIIVKFVRRDDKFLILKTARNKTTRVKGLFVNESLTPTRSKILHILRQAKKIDKGVVTGTSTLNGRVFAHHKPSSTAPDDADSLKTEINTMENLEEFCKNFIKRSLESFLESQEESTTN